MGEAVLTVENLKTYLHPNHWAYSPNLKDPGYDPQKAADMLEAAGWLYNKNGTD